MPITSLIRLFETESLVATIAGVACFGMTAVAALKLFAGASSSKGIKATRKARKHRKGSKSMHAMMAFSPAVATEIDPNAADEMPAAMQSEVSNSPILANRNSRSKPTAGETNAYNDHNGEEQGTRRLEAGDRVLALWRGESWHPATITSMKPMGSGDFLYAVVYDDGEAETRIPPSALQSVGVTAEPKASKRVPPTEADSKLPDLDDCIVYMKDGGKSMVGPVTRSEPSAVSRPGESPDNALVEEEEGDVEAEEDEDGFVMNVVQSESDWKRAAPKIRRPPVTRRAEAKTPNKGEANISGKNRKRRERQRQHKLTVREIMRSQL